ncbi:hypothetical protein MKW94_025149 [Papaver nudicaule]|uniref:Protein kinase domain-containing protein n=1 Tax=Papaver nudicaule TaxID=74823 RepID=A0AA41VBZ9_PAPNU|nr:hypothetical protein [Papaver nudicaule]
MASKKSGLARFFGFAGSSSSDAEGHSTTKITKFKFQELAAATRNFAPELLLGEGPYSGTYKGCLKRGGQVVAVKQFNEERMNDIFGYGYDYQPMFSAVYMHSLLHHPNIVDMIGYCIHGNQIYFVYDFMPLGSLKDYLDVLPPNKKPLDWNTRMKIAAGAAKGLNYLHDKSNPHGNIRPSNILLSEGYEPKLTDFLMFKERVPEVDESNYCRTFRPCTHHAPEFITGFKRTGRSDVYSFGLVLLELITGRMAKINLCLVKWAQRKLVGGEEFTTVADPLLKGQYPEQGLYQALSLTAECLQFSDRRPLIGYVVNVLSNLASEIYDPNAIQINLAGSLAIGNIQKEKLIKQWRHVTVFCSVEVKTQT